MEYSLDEGWLVPVRRVASPNCDERPAGCAVDLLVVHGISLPPREYGGHWIDALFTNTLDPQVHPYFYDIHDKRVSAHVLIGRDGLVTQYVPFDRRAWHAGASSFKGRAECNDFSIGIELEGSDDDPYEDIQYQQLARIARVLMRHYPGITREHVVGHSDIAPGRKTDPGPHFDWNRLYTLLDPATLRQA
jgi:N-acetyl-anhydromuramoyl-L-alanine amidase